MTNNTTADTSASGAGEAFVEAWLVGNDESGPYVLRRKSTGWLYEVPLVRKSAHDTLRAQLEAAEADAARLRVDAERWRHARKLLTIDDIEGAQGAFDSFGRLISEEECARADTAIDAAKAATP